LTIAFFKEPETVVHILLGDGRTGQVRLPILGQGRKARNFESLWSGEQSKGKVTLLQAEAGHLGELTEAGSR